LPLPCLIHKLNTPSTQIFANCYPNLSKLILIFVNSCLKDWIESCFLLFSLFCIIIYVLVHLFFSVAKSSLLDNIMLLAHERSTNSHNSSLSISYDSILIVCIHLTIYVQTRILNIATIFPSPALPPYNTGAQTILSLKLNSK